MFDDDTNTWTLTTRAGETCHARVVVACESPFGPWIPNLPGRNDFRGLSFHAAAPDPDFDPAAQRIAVVGADATAGRLISRLTKPAASVKVFPLTPRRVVPQARQALPASPGRGGGITHRRGYRRASAPSTAFADVDTIIYGTGFAVRDGNGPL